MKYCCKCGRKVWENELERMRSRNRKGLRLYGGGYGDEKEMTCIVCYRKEIHLEYDLDGANYGKELPKRFNSITGEKL